MLKTIFILCGVCSIAHAERFVVNKIIARVNDKSMYLSSLQERRIIKNGAPYTFEELTTEELLCQKATDMGLIFNKQEVESSINSFKIVNNLAHLSDEEFDRELKNNLGINLLQYRDQMTRLLTAQRMQYYAVNHKVVITAQEVEAYCKEHPEYNEAEYHIKLLMLDKKTKKMSHEMLKDHGSWQDLGWFTEQDLDPVFMQAIADLQDGQISKPIEHEGAEQLVMRVQKNPRHLKPLEHRYAAVERLLHEEKMLRIGDEFGEELRSESMITFPR